MCVGNSEIVRERTFALVKRIGRFVLVPGWIELNIQLMKANERAALLISRQVHALDVLFVFEELKAFGVKFVGVLSADVCPAKAAASLESAFARDKH
jgi:hypothetical protein